MGYYTTLYYKYLFLKANIKFTETNIYFLKLIQGLVKQIINKKTNIMFSETNICFYEQISCETNIYLKQWPTTLHYTSLGGTLMRNACHLLPPPHPFILYKLHCIVLH